jgi:hypothetical protein
MATTLHMKFHVAANIAGEEKCVALRMSYHNEHTVLSSILSYIAAIFLEFLHCRQDKFYFEISIYLFV